VGKLQLATFSAAKRMARAFSDDLRRRILAAYERENISQSALAQGFGVSYDDGKKIRKQQLRTGQMERAPQSRHGGVSRVTAEVQPQLQTAVRQPADITRWELQERLQKARGVGLSQSLLGLWLQKLGLRRKKNRFTRKSATRNATGSGGKSSAKSSARSRRNG
jgi:transposase